MFFKLKQAEKEKERESRKFFFVCNLNAPAQITPEEERNLVKFQP